MVMKRMTRKKAQNDEKEFKVLTGKNMLDDFDSFFLVGYNKKKGIGHTQYFVDDRDAVYLGNYMKQVIKYWDECDEDSFKEQIDDHRTDIDKDDNVEQNKMFG